MLKKRFSLRMGPYDCRLSWLSLSCLIVGAAFLLSLSNWQYTRGKDREYTQEKLARQLYPTVYVSSHDLSKASVLDYVQITCELDTDHTLYWDNQHFDGKFGYEVISPCLFNDGATIMVARGFVALENQHDRYAFPTLPNILQNERKVTLSGYLDKFPTNALLKQAFEKEDKQWPKLIQDLNPAAIEKVLEKPINPMLLQLQENSPYAFLKKKGKPWLTPEKHYGYALQWLLLALTYTLIFIIGNTRARYDR